MVNIGQREVLELLERIKPQKVDVTYIKQHIKDCPTAIPTSLMKLRHTGMVKFILLKKGDRNGNSDKNRVIYYYWVE